ncbi:DUF1385 domain-containing protein [Alkalicella caledoniensis]|uniref:DUF1385 domain-containing protein n=1 Tax=Alkalicella caledoniensis TaxID=2731377 RepID=A0A7G9W4X9_ALKCA|nr:DUF1385 domain-containing protein [Alkalicella caledoniensis]QNO13741.1 DUF1385 domain-containing protein [Alkalicella caledoniensis]
MGIRISGNAVFNGINFSSTGINVRVRQKGDSVTSYSNYSFPGINTRKKKSKKTYFSIVNNFLLRTPFIRGPYNVFKMVKKAWKLILPMIAICTIFVSIILFFSPSLKDAVLSDTLETSSELLMQGGLILFLLAFFYFSPISKYHGAEHQAINALLSNKVVTMDSLRKASRVSIHCGTVYVFLVFIIYPVLSYLIEMHWALLLAISLGYELFRAEQKWLMFVLKPIYLLALAIQKYVTTRKPDEKHLRVAFSGIRRVENSVILNKALKHIDNNRFQIADEIIGNMISMDYNNPINHFYKAYSLFKQGKYVEAKDYIEATRLQKSVISKDIIQWLVQQVESGIVNG